MTVVRPFQGVRSDPRRVELSRVIGPPDDVIASDERGAFFDRDPHNAIRFELTRDVADEAAADYAWIRSTLDAWLQAGVLCQDATPGLYVMGQTDTAPSGERLMCKGEVRPEKSTFFFPKIPTGMVFREHRSAPGDSA